MKVTDWGTIEPELSDMVGKTFSKVYVKDDIKLIFEGFCGTFKFYHFQDCCESVYIESIVGDLQDLVGVPILKAEKIDGETPYDWGPDGEPESFTWTFYKFATRKGYVDVRWLGESNGYYSEEVDFSWEPRKDK